MSSNLQNSIWPNTDGNLGNIKVQIPDGVNTFWPDGDALVHNFVFKDGKLAGFVDTKALTVNDTKSTTINYDYVDIELPFTEGEIAITRGERSKYFNVRYSPINDDNVIITLKYKGCKTVSDIKAVDPNYKTTDINADGEWFEKLDDLTNGSQMFYNCDALTAFYVDLPSLLNGYNMFGACTNLFTFNGDLPSLTDGTSMFSACTNLSSFNGDLSKLDYGTNMFYKTNLSQFTSDMPSLTNCESMFERCSNLTSFNSDLPSLLNSYKMFYRCTNLSSFNGDLSSLTDGTSMFHTCTNLSSFTSDLPSLTHGQAMFDGCTSLTSFTSDLSRYQMSSSLTDGDYMFYDCSNLTTFTSNLSSLTDGEYMFYACKLDTASVQNIANTINTVTGLPTGSHKIDIGIGNSSPNEQEKEAFNKMVDKGWIVYVNGSSFGSSCGATCCASLTTIDETDGEFITPKPFWAKPVPSDEQHARYIDEQGNFYNILGAQFIYGDDLSTYGMFTSLEDAAANMRLTKIGEEEIETA